MEKNITISFLRSTNHFVTAIHMLHVIGFRGCCQHEKIRSISVVVYFVLLLKISDLLTIMQYFWLIRFMMLATKFECLNVEFSSFSLLYIFEKLQKIIFAIG